MSLLLKKSEDNFIAAAWAVYGIISALHVIQGVTGAKITEIR